MKQIYLSTILIFYSSISFGESIDYDFLIDRNGVFYKKFTELAFTGKTTGRIQSKILNGVFDGDYVEYDYKGQIAAKGSYKDGKQDGPWEIYSTVYGVISEKGSFKKGKKDGPWENYFANGEVMEKGSFKKGKKDGPWERRFNNGKLYMRGSYDKDNESGIWEVYELNGQRKSNKCFSYGREKDLSYCKK